MAGMGVHPLYGKMIDKWSKGRDSYEGEDAIKDGGIIYLPATSGQRMDGQGKPGTPGEEEYQAYKLRAVYPDIYKEAVEAAIGIMHREPPNIDLPATMEPIRDDCTLLGESLEMLLRKINARQLITGRLGLLGDIRKDEDGSTRPVVATYNEMAIRNWDDTSIKDDDVDVRLVVLDESGYEMDDNFTWTHVEKYRVLALTNDAGNVARDGDYGTALLRDQQEISAATFTAPSLMGTKLDFIPFVFVNSKDLSPEPDNPPLEGLANLCLAIYRGEADYRQHLFQQGQDTLVRIGAQADPDESVRTGAGARLDVPLGGDAKYIGVNSTGLSEQRQSLDSDYKRAIQKSGQLLDATSRAKESGDALRIRVAAQTATLPQIAKTGAAALQKVLRGLAVWYGANPDEVVVTPNLNFTEADLNGKTLVEIMQAKGLGAPIGEESVHEWMQDQGFTKLTYEQEMRRLAGEEPAPGTNIPSPVDTNDNDGE